jgi:hypothetical protein
MELSNSKSVLAYSSHCVKLPLSIVLNPDGNSTARSATKKSASLPILKIFMGYVYNRMRTFIEQLHYCGDGATEKR